MKFKLVEDINNDEKSNVTPAICMNDKQVYLPALLSRLEGMNVSDRLRIMQVISAIS